MTGKVFENVNAKRKFVSLYEEMPEERKATFGQNIRDMFDQKITDTTRIEGFYLNEADVQVCYDAAMKTPKSVTRVHIASGGVGGPGGAGGNANSIGSSGESMITSFKEQEDEDFNKPAETESNIPKDW